MKEDALYWALHQALSSGQASHPMQGILPVSRPDVPQGWGTPLQQQVGARYKVLNILHAAHQEKWTMLHKRCSQTIFWPGYTIDVNKKRDGCNICNHNAPSPRCPPILEHRITLAGVHYLITVDRLSGWLDITWAASGTPGAKGLTACLRTLFVDYSWIKGCLKSYRRGPRIYSNRGKGVPQHMASHTDSRSLSRAEVGVNPVRPVGHR